MSRGSNDRWAAARLVTALTAASTAGLLAVTLLAGAPAGATAERAAPGATRTSVGPAPGAAVTGTAATDVVAVTTGDRHSCALTDGGRVWCWGANDRGQLGRDEPEGSDVPVLVDAVSGVRQIAAGGSHTCAVTGDGTWCWGANGSGQVGDGTTGERAAPGPSLAAGVTQVSAGRAHTCGVAAQGSHEVQSLTVSASGGTFRLRCAGAVSGPVPWDASPREVESAIDALSANWSAEVRRGIGPGYVITFSTGSLAHRDVDLMSVDGGGLRGAAARADTASITDGGWRLLCWGADGAAQLGRGPVTHADVVPDVLTTAPDGDITVARGDGGRLWRFGDDGTFRQLLPALGFAPSSIGAARAEGTDVLFAVNGSQDSARAGEVVRFDIASGQVDRRYDPADDERVLPPTWTCHCQTRAMAVDPSDGSVFVIYAGTAGPTSDQAGAPFAKLIRVAPDLSGSIGDGPVDLVGGFPRVAGFTGLASGRDADGLPVLYALQQPAPGQRWRMSLWDTAGDRLAVRTTFAVSPEDRGTADGSYDSACPARSTTAGQAVDGVWSRRVRTGIFDFGPIGAAGGGDVGVVTGYGYSEQEQRYLKADGSPGDPSVDAGSWEDHGTATRVTDLGACVNVFAAGSQGAYGRYRATLRGSGPAGTRLGVAPVAVAAVPDGRILIADPEHDRIQQFTAEGEPLTDWPGSQFAAAPTGSHAVAQALVEATAEVGSVSAGDAHTCLATRSAGADGPVLCWGSDSAGQLDHRDVPTPLPMRAPRDTGSSTGFAVVATDPSQEDPGGPAVAVTAGTVAAGGAHTCTRDGDGSVAGTRTLCWGAEGLGQLGGTTLPGSPVVRVPRRLDLLTAGGSGTCSVVVGGFVECWGPDELQVQGLADVTSLDVGGRHACAVAGEGEIRCWGADGSGQTGPDGDGSARPALVELRPRVTAVPPTGLGDPIVVSFEDGTSGVTTAGFRLTDGDDDRHDLTVTCRGESGRPVDCRTGAVRTAAVTPDGGVVAGESYRLTVAPDGGLESGGVPIPVTDLEISTPLALAADDLGDAYAWAGRSDRAAYGGRVLVEEAPGATLDYSFRGPRVVWYTRRGPTEGIATVLVDGRVVRRVDNSAVRGHSRVPVRLTGLGRGRHTVTIRVEGKRGTRARGRSVTVDAFRAKRLAREPEVVTTWGGLTLGERTVRRAGARGSRVTFRFRGSQVTWHTVGSRVSGRVRVLLDGAVVQQYDGFEDVAVPTPVAIAIPAGPGVHELTLVGTGTGAGRRHYAYVEAVEVTP